MLELGETRSVWTKGGAHTGAIEMTCIDEANNIWSERGMRGLNYRLLQDEHGNMWAQSNATTTPWPAVPATLRMFGRVSEKEIATAKTKARQMPPTAGQERMARIERKLDQLLEFHDLEIEIDADDLR